MKPVTYKCFDITELKKAFHYAKGLLEIAKFGVLVTVSTEKQQRSVRQNAYLWSLVYAMLAEEMGYTVDEVHQIMSKMFLKIKEVEINDEIFVVVKSTTKLKTDEFEEYTENCRRYGAINLQIYIPLPNESPDSWDN